MFVEVPRQLTFGSDNLYRFRSGNFVTDPFVNSRARLPIDVDDHPDARHGLGERFQTLKLFP
jgi:hypothetical protein